MLCSCQLHRAERLQINSARTKEINSHAMKPSTGMPLILEHTTSSRTRIRTCSHHRAKFESTCVVDMQLKTSQSQYEFTGIEREVSICTVPKHSSSRTTAVSSSRTTAHVLRPPVLPECTCMEPTTSHMPVQAKLKRAAPFKMLMILKHRRPRKGQSQSHHRKTWWWLPVMRKLPNTWHLRLYGLSACERLSYADRRVNSMHVN